MRDFEEARGGGPVAHQVPYRIEQPGDDGGAAARAFVHRWLDQPAVREVVEAGGAAWPSNPESWLVLVEQLHALSERWDRRRGRERADVVGDREPLAGSAAVLAGAARLGLGAAWEPTARQYDHGLVLGGTILSNANRVRRVGELRAAGMDLGQVVALTALRRIEDQERTTALEAELAADVVEAETEFDVLVRLFAGSEQCEPTACERSETSASAMVGDVRIIAAPSSDPARRANTSDNLRAYIRDVEPGDALLLVTNSIYLPYQLLASLMALGWERALALEAVGFPPEWMRDSLNGPEHVLQELRSAFSVMRSIVSAIDLEKR